MERRDRDQFDQLLDGALQQYGNVEPRVGLEGRVLANLKAQNRFVPHRRWASVFAITAGICAVSLIVGVVATRHHSGKPIESVSRPPAVASSASTDLAMETSVREKPRTKSARPGTEIAAETATAKPSPRLSQFPSQRPLSEQEELLVRYVRESPQEAVLVARAQAEREKELEKLIRDESPNVDQQER
jgi:hypothetical protein